MRQYCLGFVFDAAHEHVVLLQKRASDAFNPGAWNGVGGKLEPEEAAVQAMAREAHEEAGLVIAPEAWCALGQLTDGQRFAVQVFAASGDISGLRSNTDERVHAWTRAEVKGLPCATDVHAILAPWIAGGRLIA